MNKNERLQAIEDMRREADERYGADGWTSVYKSFSLPDGTSETVRVLNPVKRQPDDEADADR